LSEHVADADGAAVFQQACVMGLEGIVAKRRDSRYRSGRCREWIKVKNRAHPAFERAMLIALNKRTVQDDGDDRSTRRLQAPADLTYMGRAASRQDRAMFAELRAKG
jgi:ATP-dependent DNA ligase